MNMVFSWEAKAKNVSVEKKQQGWGDVWTWMGIDAYTKLCVSYLVGGRDGGWAMDFIQDCADRIRSRVQVTTDAHRPYLNAVESAFGVDLDHAKPNKIYGASADFETRYSPATCIGCDIGGERESRPEACHMVAIYFAYQISAVCTKRCASLPQWKRD